MNKELNKIVLVKEMKREQKTGNFLTNLPKRGQIKDKYSKRDIMVKGKRVSFETPIKNYKLSELIYGDKESQNKYTEVWENFKRYN